MEFKIVNIREVLYSTGSLDKVLYFFEDYGGWNRVGQYKTDKSVLTSWELVPQASADEYLLQSNHYPSGQIRLFHFEGVDQSYIRSSQQPWDIGGIMDINLRIQSVEGQFEELRALGWHGLSDPMLQEMGPFKLYDVLMRGYDDTIVAFTRRLEPPMTYTSDIKLPTHVYKTSIVVEDLAASRKFYEEGLGFKIMTEYEVKKDSPQETMFGLPFNLADKVTCSAMIISPHGGKDTDFQLVTFDGVTGKNFVDKAMPPHRGFFGYRIEVEGLDAYFAHVIAQDISPYRPITSMIIQPYGHVRCFAVRSSEGSIFEFFEIDP